MALVAWSSIGLELSRLGVPVLRTHADGISFYPNEGIYHFERTLEGYFRQLEELLQRKPLFEQFREAFRWYHSIYLAPSLLLDEVSPSPAFQGFPEPRDSRQFDALERVITRGETPSDINFAQLKSGLSESSEYVELAAMCACLGRLFVFLATNHDPGRGVFLEVNGMRCLVGQSEGSVTELRAGEVNLVFGGETTLRYSPMLSRFVPALVEAYRTLESRYGRSRTLNEAAQSSSSF